MRHDSLEELTCAGDLQRRIGPANTIFKLASIAKEVMLAARVKEASILALRA